jgi:hypothetical protein
MPYNFQVGNKNKIKLLKECESELKTFNHLQDQYCRMLNNFNIRVLRDTYDVTALLTFREVFSSIRGVTVFDRSKNS